MVYVEEIAKALKTNKGKEMDIVCEGGISFVGTVVGVDKSIDDGCVELENGFYSIPAFDPETFFTSYMIRLDKIVGYGFRDLEEE